MEAVGRYVTAPATVIDDIGDLLSELERHALVRARIERFCSQSCVTSDT